MGSTMILKRVFWLVIVVQCSSAHLTENVLDPIASNEPARPVNDAISRTCSTSNRYSGIQMIYPQPGFGEPFEVYCEQEYEDGGWVVIQNRFDGSVNFERDWEAYENGFGDMSGEHWLGLKKIHELTYSKQYKLHILLELKNGTELIAKYSEFLVAGSTEMYELKSVGGFSGDVMPELRYQMFMKFSTFDSDNDVYFGNCAKLNQGGWWYSSCGLSLNDLYRDLGWYPYYQDIKKTRMMIKNSN